MPRGISRFDEMLIQQDIQLVGQQVINYENINDPFFSNVVFLLHGNGTNGSTIINDNSIFPKNITRVGDTQISTTQAKFGGSSIYFDGAGTPTDRLTIPVNTDPFQFGSGDFTIESWVYRLNTNTSAIFAGQSDLTTAAGSSTVFYLSSTATSDLYIGNVGSAVASPNPSINTWAHVAWVRRGNTFYSFLNGTLLGSTSVIGSVNLGTPTYPNTIGSFATNSTGFNGYMNEYRITKGIGRYTANFTPPTAPFPDF